MTEPTKENVTPQPAQPANIAGIPLASVLSIGSGLIGKFLEASPLGIAAASIFGLIGFFVIRNLIKKFNASVDKRDDANAGALAGEASVDLRNQANQIKNELNQAQNMDPPKSGGS